MTSAEINKKIKEYDRQLRVLSYQIAGWVVVLLACVGYLVFLIHKIIDQL